MNTVVGLLSRFRRSVSIRSTVPRFVPLAAALAAAPLFLSSAFGGALVETVFPLLVGALFLVFAFAAFLLPVAALLRFQFASSCIFACWVCQASDFSAMDAQRHDIEYQTVQREFEGRDDAIAWMEDNQLGRRNLSPNHFRLLLGRKNNRLKKKQGGQDGNDNAAKQTPQNDGFVSTAEKLAKEHGVGRATVERAGAAAEIIDNDAIPELREAVERDEMSVSAAGIFPTGRVVTVHSGHGWRNKGNHDEF